MNERHKQIKSQLSLCLPCSMNRFLIFHSKWRSFSTDQPKLSEVEVAKKIHKIWIANYWQSIDIILLFSLSFSLFLLSYVIFNWHVYAHVYDDWWMNKQTNNINMLILFNTNPTNKNNKSLLWGMFKFNNMAICAATNPIEFIANVKLNFNKKPVVEDEEKRWRCLLSLCINDFGYDIKWWLCRIM